MASSDGLNAEIFFVCKAFNLGSIYRGQPQGHISNLHGVLDAHRHFEQDPNLSDDIPQRARDLFIQAVRCRQLVMQDAVGAMFRKTIDVATQEIYSSDPRLVGKNAADALRWRINALGQLRVLDEEIVELADVALMDGNDAAHDVDPYKCRGSGSFGRSHSRFA